MINGAQAAWIGTAARDLALERLADRNIGQAVPDPATPAVEVVCLPAQDGPDEAAAAVLAELLQHDGIGAAAISDALLFSEKIAATEAPGVCLVVVSSVGPASDLYTRRIRKALQRTLRDVPVIVAAWVRPGVRHGPARASRRGRRPAPGLHEPAGHRAREIAPAATADAPTPGRFRAPRGLATPALTGATSNRAP